MATAEITVSLDWAKRLKAAGWPQGDTSFYWTWSSHPSREPEIRLSYSNDPRFKKLAVDQRIAAAPSAEEILRKLPVDVMIDGKEYRIEMLKRHGEKSEKFYVNLRGYKETIEVINSSFADATAAVYCYLSENNLLPASPSL